MLLGLTGGVVVVVVYRRGAGAALVVGGKMVTDEPAGSMLTDDPTNMVADAPCQPACCCCRSCCHCCCRCCCARAVAPAFTEPPIARSNSALSIMPSWLVSMASKRSPPACMAALSCTPTCADLAGCVMLPPLEEDSMWSSMGISEQTDDAGEDGTSKPTSETPLFLLLLPPLNWRLDFAAVSFLQSHQMPKQRRQARSSRRGIHHHVRACS